MTMPGTRVTVCPASGDSRVVPWMSWTRTVPGSVEPSSPPPPPSPEPAVSPAELNGEGAPVVRSAALSSVSARDSARETETVLDAPAAGPLPSRTTALP